MKFTTKTTGYYHASDKTPIYYETYGEGEPVVLVYGLACLINHWHHQIEFLSQNYKVIVFDIRGHHKSTPVLKTENLSLDHLASDMKGLINHLGYESAHFAGHSFGVPYLIYANLVCPEIFRSFIFINGFAKNPLNKIPGFDVVEMLYFSLKNIYDKAPDLMTTLWRSSINNPLAMQIAALSGGFNLKLTQYKDVEQYVRGVSRLELSVFFELFKYVLFFNATDLLQYIKVPTLVIAGDKDMITPVTFQKEIADGIKKSKFVVLPYGSHCCQLDYPELVNFKMQDFLKGTP